MNKQNHFLDEEIVKKLKLDDPFEREKKKTVTEFVVGVILSTIFYFVGCVIIFFNFTLPQAIGIILSLVGVSGLIIWYFIPAALVKIMEVKNLK